MVNKIVLLRLSLHFHLSNLFALEEFKCKRLTHKILFKSNFHLALFQYDCIFFTTFITSLFSILGPKLKASPFIFLFLFKLIANLI